MKFCPLFSGSSGNSIFVSGNKGRILIDAGMAGKAIEQELKNIDVLPSTINGIFVTHEHSDHIKGVGILSRKYDIPIFAKEETWNAMMNKLGKLKEHNIKVITGNENVIEDLVIENFPISHDAVDPIGYKIHHQGKSACIATDLGVFSEAVKKALEDSDIILLESNHDVEMLKFGPYPYPLKKRILSVEGHLSNDDCGKAILNILNEKHKTIYLGHLSKTNNYPQLAYETVANLLRENSVDIHKDLTLTMCNRDKHSMIVEL